MDGYFVLFDAHCPSCTEVAMRLRQLKVQDVTVASLADPAVIALFSQADRQLPCQPALVHIAGRRLKVWSGPRMRLRLVRILGLRRAAEIVSLILMEAGAHVARRSDKASWVSRRSLLTSAAAGAGALVLGSALPAAAKPSPDEGTPLDADAARRFLASPAFQRARRIWGDADESAVFGAVTPRGEQVAMIPHSASGQRVAALTAVGADDVSLGITLAPNDNRDGVRYFLASGVPLAEQAVRDGRLTTTPLDAEAAPPLAEAQPAGTQEFIACFVACMGASVSPECVIACGGCLFGPSGPSRWRARPALSALARPG